jgi:hypothetical protein
LERKADIKCVLAEHVGAGVGLRGGGQEVGDGSGNPSNGKMHHNTGILILKGSVMRIPYCVLFWHVIAREDRCAILHCPETFTPLRLLGHCSLEI